MQFITLRGNWIMMCKSIAWIKVDRDCLHCTSFSWIDMPSISSRGFSFSPRKPLVILYACFSLSSCFFSDIVNTYRTPWMSALCRGMYLFGRNSFFDHPGIMSVCSTATLTNLLRPVSMTKYSKFKLLLLNTDFFFLRLLIKISHQWRHNCGKSNKVHFKEKRNKELQKCLVDKVFIKWTWKSIVKCPEMQEQNHTVLACNNWWSSLGKLRNRELEKGINISGTGDRKPLLHCCLLKSLDMGVFPGRSVVLVSLTPLISDKFFTNP